MAANTSATRKELPYHRKFNPGDEKVEILVGPDEQDYHIPKQLLNNGMDFFDAVNLSAPYRLPQEDTVMFDAFVSWLYNSEIIKTPTRLTLINLWIFAAKIECNKLQNFALDALQDIYLAMGQWMDKEEVKHIFDRTKNLEPDNPLVTFTAAMLNCYAISEPAGLTYVHDTLKLIPDALYPYLKYQSDNQDFNLAAYDPAIRDESTMCEFHVHGPEDACRSTVNNQ